MSLNTFFSSFQQGYNQHSKSNQTQSMSTPVTSSILSKVETFIETEAKVLEKDFVYTVSSAYDHIKAEVEKLENNILAHNKAINSNNDSIKSLQSKNAAHATEVSSSLAVAASLKSIVSS